MKTSNTKRVRLDTERMLRDIDELLEDDFAFDVIDCKRLPGAKPYSQKEALEMANRLGKIYMIAHVIHCKACQQGRYTLPHKKQKK